MSLLEFEASYLPFESLLKNFASDMTVYNTPSLPLQHHLMKFYIRAELLDTKLLVLRFRRLPEQTRMQKYIYGNFANFNPQAIVDTCKIVYFTRQRFARAIIDVKTLRSLLLNISCIFGISRRTSCMLFFINAY